MRTLALPVLKVCDRIGLPAGVLNIVHGLGGECGAAIVAHPDVLAVSFTGGTATGKLVAATAAPMFKKLSLELGGKNATVVLDDADVDTVVPEVVRAGFSNQGQVCDVITCVSASDVMVVTPAQAMADGGFGHVCLLWLVMMMVIVVVVVV